MPEMNNACPDRPQESCNHSDEDIFFLQLHARLGPRELCSHFCDRLVFDTPTLFALWLLFRLRLLFIIVILAAPVLIRRRLCKLFRVTLDLGLNETCTTILHLIVE